jgi:flagellar assembly protein FliH
MSDVIKVKSKARVHAKVGGGETIQTEYDADYLKKQLDEYYSAGYKDGQEKTRRELEQDYTNKLLRKYEETYNILQHFDEKFVEYESSFESLVIETAFQVAEKIVQKEIEDRSIINESVRGAINKIMGANEVRLKLNPLDADELDEKSNKLINNSSFNRIKIDSDERIEKGGCLIETEIGSVDARIATQLDEIKKIMVRNIDK